MNLEEIKPQIAEIAKKYDLELVIFLPSQIVRDECLDDRGSFVGYITSKRLDRERFADIEAKLSLVIDNNVKIVNLDDLSPKILKIISEKGEPLFEAKQSSFLEWKIYAMKICMETAEWLRGLKDEIKASVNIHKNNFAFIDSQNLNLSILELGWKVDWKRFRVYLKEKYDVSKAYIFLGYIAGNNDLYAKLQESGFVCIFKPTLTYKDGSTKGNCDAELVLQAMIDFVSYDKAVIVTGDGDFQCLAKYLVEQDKLVSLMIPNKNRFSALLKFEIFRKHTHYMNDLRSKLEYKKRPHKDETL